MGNEARGQEGVHARCAYVEVGELQLTVGARFVWQVLVWAKAAGAVSQHERVPGAASIVGHHHVEEAVIV